jgi:hypothetical protein
MLVTLMQLVFVAFCHLLPVAEYKWYFYKHIIFFMS